MADYAAFLATPPDERRGAFLTTAARLSTGEGNVEKDFWVCWTLDVLFHRLTGDQPRLLFKGGTSLSKGYNLISRFSEDVDVTVFRDDLGQSVSVHDLEALSGQKRRAKLEGIKKACQAYIEGPMREQLGALLAGTLADAGIEAPNARIELDPDDPDRQTLLLWYPAVSAPEEAAYVRPAVKIESGAKSALDPNHPVTVRPYVDADLPALNLSVDGVTTVDPDRTFWDKVVIAHGLRRWFEKRGVLRGAGQRVSRHYYDLHRLMDSDVGPAAAANLELGEDCVAHARMFFNSPDLDLASAKPGQFALVPTSTMLEALERDYRAMSGMIFGQAPPFAAVMDSVAALEAQLNIPATA
jgi:Nucleotidyl transferase AbiEii toxin, Type IV TA system